MPEALECWPVSLVQELMPRVMQIIYEINERFCKELWNYFPNDFQKISKLAIVAADTVRMAHLAIAGSFSINGVSALHSEILKERVFTDFYKIYSSKFCNVTNGIAHRRWLCEANPELAELIESKIGTGYRTHPSELQVLANYAGDKELLSRLGEIKRHNKQRLADYIKAHNGIEINMDSIFDVQVKRLHEYKRQMLNISAHHQPVPQAEGQSGYGFRSAHLYLRLQGRTGLRSSEEDHPADQLHLQDDRQRSGSTR